MTSSADKLMVTLTAGEWNTVLALLGKAPFEVCAELILNIRAQCMAQPPAPNREEAAHAPD